MPTKKNTVEIEIRLNLPDSVAREAEACGLLEPGSLEAMLCGELRRRRVDRLFEAADQLGALPEPPLTEQELEVEVQADRAGRATRLEAVRELSSFHVPVIDPEDLERESISRSSEVARRARQLVESGVASWNGGKPRGSRPRPRVKGKSASDVVLEDRR